MPQITPQSRVQINADPENFQQPRRSITQSTGMNMPKLGKPAEAAQTGQPATTEGSAAPAVTLSPHLTALARKQQDFQKKVQEQRDKEAAWEKEKAAYVPRDSFKAKATQNAEAALADLGLSYEEITNLLIAQKNGADPVQALAEEVKQLKASQEDSVNKQFDAVIKNYKTEAKNLVTKDTTKFAFLEANPEWIDGAVQYIVDEWEANPDNVVSIEDALDLAEENLRDDAKKHAAILEKLNPKTPVQEQVPSLGKKTLPPPKTQAPRTLTQAVESTSVTRTYNQFQHMSMKERIAAAVARASK